MDNENQRVIRVTEIDSERLSRLESQVSQLREEGASRTSTIDNIQKTVNKLEDTIYGNGKEGLKQIVARMELKVDHIYEFIEDVPAMVEKHITDGIDKFALSMNSQKIRAIADEAVNKSIKAAQENPGSWESFKKSWVYPVAIAVLCTLAGGLLTHFLWP